MLKCIQILLIGILALALRPLECNSAEPLIITVQPTKKLYALNEPVLLRISICNVTTVKIPFVYVHPYTPRIVFAGNVEPEKLDANYKKDETIHFGTDVIINPNSQFDYTVVLNRFIGIDKFGEHIISYKGLIFATHPELNDAVTFKGKVVFSKSNDKLLMPVQYLKNIIADSSKDSVMLAFECARYMDIGDVNVFMAEHQKLFDQHPASTLSIAMNHLDNPEACQRAMQILSSPSSFSGNFCVEVFDCVYKKGKMNDDFIAMQLKVADDIRNESMIYFLHKNKLGRICSEATLQNFIKRTKDSNSLKLAKELLDTMKIPAKY